MDIDDIPVGRLLTRRQALERLAATGMVMLAGMTGAIRGVHAAADEKTILSAPRCVVRPERTEGPYFVDQQINRSDIRKEPSTGEITPGVLLTLAFNVSNVSGGCEPLVDAMVDIWHCDARGIYSGTADSFQGYSTKGLKFLRGYQMTDAQGYARFVTIYPGWYKGRAVHLHFKIRSKAPDGGNYEFTSQLFFDDVLSDRIYAKSPYAGRGMRDTRNNNDQHYQRTGDQLQVNLTESSQGYVAIFDIGLDLNDAEAGRSDGFQPPPGGPPPGNPPPGAFGGPPGSPPVTR